MPIAVKSGWENPTVSLEQISVGGIYLPIFLAFLLATGLMYMVLRIVLLRVHAYRMFWHPALAGASLFVIILASLMLAFGP